MSNLEFQLLENGLDSILKAFEEIEGDDERGLKYGILHLDRGISLVLKAKLKEEDWKLLFQDIEKADETLLHSGNFKSVDFKNSLSRICLDLDIEISADHLNILKRLHTLRNKIEHFEVSVSIEEVKSLFHKAGSFAFDFANDHLETSEIKSELLEYLNEPLFKNAEFLKERRIHISPRLSSLRKESYFILDCPMCFEEALVPGPDIGPDQPICLFCKYTDTPENVADEWATKFVGYPHTDPKERMIEPVLKECPSGFCFSETMIEFTHMDGGATPPDPYWICFACGAYGSFEVSCQHCGEKFVPKNYEDYPYTCDECRLGQTH
jgi:hypothetical protein